MPNKYPNGLGGGGGGGTGANGATSITVESANQSVTQIGQSSYNPITRQLVVNLTATGGDSFQGMWYASTGLDYNNNPLPTPSASNADFYWLCDAAGMLPASIGLPPSGYQVGDKIVSNGANYFYQAAQQTTLDSQIRLSQAYPNTGTVVNDTQANYNENNDNNIGTLNTAVATNAQAIATETTNRTSADANLQTQIDTTNQNLTTEVTNRQNADTNLQNQINATNQDLADEVTRAQGVETNLQTQINNKQNLVPTATNQNLAMFNNAGQTVDSGIDSAEVTQMGNTFNNPDQLVQLDPQGAYPNNSASNTTVTNPLTSLPASLQSTLNEIAAGGTGTGTVMSVQASGTNHITATVTGTPNINPVVEVTSDGTDANTPSTLVARDINGNFSAGTITATLDGNATTSTTATNFTGQLVGDVTGTQDATVVAQVGGQTAADISDAVDEVVNATATPTADMIAKYDANGNLVANAFNGDADDTTVTNPTTSATSTLQVALDDIYNGGSGTGTVTNVSSANTDINVATPTTTPVLTLNSSVAGGTGNENKVVKLDNTGAMGAVPVGANTTVTNPKTLAISTLNQALLDAYSSVPNINISNTLFVAKNGDDTTGNGSINNPFLTIQKAIDTATAGTQIQVFSGNYPENITLKASTAITGATSQEVILAGSVTTAVTGGTMYVENLAIHTPATGNPNAINFDGGATITNLQLANVDVQLAGGTGSAISYTNTNAGSRFVTDGICAFGVTVSTTGAKIFTSATGTAGTVILTYVSSRIADNNNTTAYSIDGAVKLYHTFDNIRGQVVVASTALFAGTFLTMDTGNIAAMTTSSTGLSTLNSCIMNTTANATAGTATVEGVGGFAYFNTSTPNTTVKGFATTLNGGVGAIAGATYGIRLDSSGIAPFTAGTSDGLIQYDGSYFYGDSLTTRYQFAYADATTHKVLASSIPIDGTTITLNGDNQLQAPLALPSVAGKTGYLLSNDGTTSTWVNSLTNVVNIQNSKTLDPVTLTTKTLYEVLTDIYVKCQPIVSSTVSWIYSSNVSTFELAIPANTKRITLFIVGLAGSSANAEVLIKSSSGGTLVTYNTVLTGSTIASNLTSQALALNSTFGAPFTIVSSNYTFNKLDTSLWVVNGEHGILSGANVATFSQNGTFDMGEDTLAGIVFSTIGNFTAGQVIAYCQ